MSEIIGSYKERPIPDWIDAPKRGGRFFFDRVAVEDRDGAIALAQLGIDEFVISPGLIYRLLPGT